MDKGNHEKKRRIPGENARKKPQKAPPLRPRKHAPAPEPTRDEPEVVYQPPKPFSRNRLILRLATVVAVVIAVVLALSIFFKVEKIEISGCDKYTAYQIQQASGIEEGSQLLTFSRARAASKILAQLPYVKTVRISISLPDTVKIEIAESVVSYVIPDQDGDLWLMDCNGKILEQTQEAGDLPVISGVTVSDPVSGEQAVAFEDGTESTDVSGNVIPVTVTAGKRLETALSVAQNLEANNILGQVVSIDVTNVFDIVLWYGSTYKIRMGEADNVAYQMALLKAAVEKCLNEYPGTAGEIDISEKGYYEFQAFTE
jgi:cell division protein FtsQ